MGLANVQNMFDTHMDIFAIYAVGEAEAEVAGLDDIHLLSERLILDLLYQDLKKFGLQNYQTRGMNTKKDEYNIIEMNNNLSSQAELTLTFFDRRFELFAGHSQGKFEMPRIRDSDGNIIIESEKPFKGETENDWRGILFDYTDDRQDPRKGIRLRATWRDSPRTDKNAVVTDEGNTNVQEIKDELGYGCDQLPAGLAKDDCSKAEGEVADLFLKERKYGNATGLGGLERLRSYPTNRFNGAHTAFYGTEIRWNLTEEATPFDYFIWKDTRTGVQLALFGGTGTVAETTGELWERSRSSYGVGFRLITASGSVYRIDWATGDEGAETTYFFFYPW